MKKNYFAVYIFALALSIVFSFTDAFGAVIHVPADQPTIQAGIDAAEIGDTILVADGTYTGDGNIEINFKGKAITVQSEKGPESTIIDCNQLGRAFFFYNQENEDSVLSGFTIKNGLVSDYGGAIFCYYYSSPTIINCIIKDNSSYYGGAIYCLVYASPTIKNCTILNNSSTQGAAIHCYYYSSPVIMDSILWDNTPAQIFAEYESYPVIINSNIEGSYTGEGNISTEPEFSVPDFSATPLSGGAPLTVNFSDLSTGFITDWEWNFGDGTVSTEQNPNHTYSALGTYTVSLNVMGLGAAKTEIKTEYITVQETQPPSADFTADTLTGIAPAEINFADQSSGDIDIWEWDFGDGTTSTEQHPAHIYESPGTYTVSLSVSGAGGSDSNTKIDFITVQTPPPVADFTTESTSGTAPLTVNFSDTSAGESDSWTWDFGDGIFSTEQNPSHSYTDSGIYTVILTVSGPGGSNSITKTDYITVQASSGDDGTNDGGIDNGSNDDANDDADDNGDDGIYESCFASHVVSYTPGQRKDGKNLTSNRKNPEKALGEPEKTNNVNFVSLGFGGELVLEFDNTIMNRVDGPDIKVTETSYGNPACSKYPEMVHVYVSSDGTEWTDLGTGCQDSEFELGELNSAKYVKLVDESNPRKFNKSADGFDVDGVEALACGSSAAETPSLYEGTIGTEFTINGSDFGTKKPLVFVEYANKAGKLRRKVVKILEWNSTKIECRWTKKMAPGTYNLFVKTAGKKRHKIEVGTFTIKEAEIAGISANKASKGDIVKITGKFFGNKFLKVLFEYSSSKNGKNRKEHLKIIGKNLEWNPRSNESALEFRIPKIKQSPVNGTLKLKNGISEITIIEGL